MPTDAELLQRYLAEKDERAFAELVRRHLGLVYATALRGTGGRVHLAQEIAQKVFGDFARKAASLRHHPVLTGWLYRSTRYATAEAQRAERRRQKHEEAFAALSDPRPELALEWERLRPVLDDALEELRERDRELVLLRFFQGLTFGEIGSRLDVSENAARMRTERALEKLRMRLDRRGVSSTAAALGLLLANQAFAAAPVGLTESVTAAALTVLPAGAMVSGFTGILLGQIAVAAGCGALTAGIALLAWRVWPAEGSAGELAALRAENSQLKAAAVVATVREESTARAGHRASSPAQRGTEKKGARPTGYANHGQQTPFAAFLTYCWALETGDAEVLSRILTYDEKERAAIRALHERMPEAIQAEFPTPEKLVVFLFIADTLVRPVPAPDVAEKFDVFEIGPGMVAVRRPDDRGGAMKWVQTPEGWKIVVPAGYPAHIAERTLGNEMLARLGFR